MDQIGFQECQKNQHLYPTFKIVPLGNLSQEGLTHHLSWSGDPAYSKNRIPNHLCDRPARFHQISIKYFNYRISLLEELDIQLNYPPVPGLNRLLHSHELLCCIKVEVDRSDMREVSKVGLGFWEMQ